MARSYRKNLVFGICCAGRGTLKAHRRQISGARRAEARDLIAKGDYEALPTRYVEDERDRPDDGRFRRGSGGFDGFLTMPAYKLRTK